MLSETSQDFLYWHASNKLNSARFKDARVLFELLRQVDPVKPAYTIGWAYCNLRLEEFSDVAPVLGAIDTSAASVLEKEVIERLMARARLAKAQAGAT